MSLDRRHFLTGLASVALSAPGRGHAVSACGTHLAVDDTAPGHPIPSDFIGLSYETSILATADYFTPANRSVLGLIGRLGRSGVIRLGGNSTERTVWRTQTGPVAPKSFVITPASIDRLAAAVRELGWQVIYGLNLARGTPDEAAAEAVYVANALGSQLIAFQVGNEPDGFGLWTAVRPGSYDFDAFLTEWRQFHAAIRSRLPHASFAGPDVAAETDWVSAFAQAKPEGLVMLTRHYYSDGPAPNPSVTLTKLLRSAPQIVPILAKLEEWGRLYRLPYRIAETNSVFQEGRPGVSDTFGAALWGAELMFQIAAAGGAGINFHSGDDKAYTPIGLSETGEHHARPLYYGMLLFAQTCRGRLVPTRLEPGLSTFSAFAAREGGRLRVALINKDPANAACVRIDPGERFRRASVLRLIGPAVDAKTGVTFGGAEVDAFGRWASTGRERAKFEGRDVLVEVPSASAAAVSLGE